MCSLKIVDDLVEDRQKRPKEYERRNTYRIAGQNPSILSEVAIFPGGQVHRFGVFEEPILVVDAVEDGWHCPSRI
jgi:hypothetical protein